MRIEEGTELARFTTLGTGGPARAFARMMNGRSFAPKANARQGEDRAFYTPLSESGCGGGDRFR